MKTLEEPITLSNNDKTKYFALVCASQYHFEGVKLRVPKKMYTHYFEALNNGVSQIYIAQMDNDANFLIFLS